jgi:hypothetical protein
MSNRDAADALAEGQTVARRLASCAPRERAGAPPGGRAQL